MNKVVRVFFETDMRNQHDGLKEVAKAEKVDLDKLSPGEHVVFINMAKDRLKMFSSGGVLSYLRSQTGKLNMMVIEQIPQCFSAKRGVNWPKAQKLALEKQLGKNPRYRELAESTKPTSHVKTKKPVEHSLQKH
jgi:hypothetical protein